MKEKNVFSSIIWRFGQVFGAQAVSLVVSIVLARLLEPEIYGTVGLVTVLITVLQVFVDGGLGVSLIQKKDSDDLDFSSVFYFNMAMCIILYCLIFCAAPYIADFYQVEILTGLIRVISLTLIISGVKSIQQTYVSKYYLFKRMFAATLVGNICGAVAGISMAYMGYGVWALAGQILVNTTVDTTLLWIMVKWRPKLIFSLQRLRGLLSYGWKVLASNLLDTVYNNLCSLIIGKRYTKEKLAFYNRGRQFPNLVSYTVNSSVDYVVFIAMSNTQDDVEKLKEMTRTSVRICSYLMWPLLMGLAACAEPFVRLLLTEKWLPCVPYMRIFCLIYAFQPLYTSTVNAVKAIGRSDVFLKLELCRKILGLLLIVITAQYGVMAMVCGELLNCLISVVMISFPGKKILRYRFLEMIQDVIPTILLSLTMAVIVWSIHLLPLSDPFVLLLQILSGMLFYLASSALFHVSGFRFLVNTVKELVVGG